MADVANTLGTSSLNALAKKVYAGEEEKLFITEQSTTVANTIKFVKGSMRPGDDFNQPVVLSREQGMTFNIGTNADAFALNATVPSVSKNASVKGSEFVLRATLSYGAMARLKGSEGEDNERAFRMGTQFVIENLRDTSFWAREISLLYGGGDAASATGTEGIGLISVGGGGGATSQTLTISLASYADGIWAGMEGAFIDIYDTTLVTPRNTGTFQVTAVNLDSRTITVSGVGVELDAVVATDKVFLKGAKAAEMNGLVKIQKNTGTLFGISASTYGLWAATTYDAGSGAASFDKIMRAMVKPANRGAGGEMVYFCPNNAWIDMMNDLSALRRFSDKGNGSIEQGANELAFYGPNGMVARFKPSPMVKNSYLIGINTRQVVRVGATDDTRRLPGSQTDDFFFQIAGYAGVELRRYWNQAVFCRRPASMNLVYNVVSST